APRRGARRPGDMARIVVAGAGAIGAGVAYHLALRGARDVVLADRGEVASGSTSKAMGGVRQQFSTEPEVRLARDSIRFFEELGPPLFLQVGYLFLATTAAGLAELEERLPMVIESETGFHFRRRDDCLRIAMPDSAPRWGTDTSVDESVFDDRLERLAHRYPAAAGTRIDHAWAGLYDMTPDAHPIIGRIGDGIYAACGFSGHGFMQSPAVGAALAELILEGETTYD